MFGLFKSRSFHEPLLGDFKRSSGLWRGSITFDDESHAPLLLDGNKSEPSVQAINAAKSLKQLFAASRQGIEASLFEHYLPYAEAVAAGDLPSPDAPLPPITKPSQVWPHVSLEFVLIAPLDGILTTEFGFTTGWDEEHTLGARFREGNFLELCGSVLKP